MGLGVTLELECKPVTQSRNNPIASEVGVSKSVHVSQPQPVVAVAGIAEQLVQVGQVHLVDVGTCLSLSPILIT